MKPTLSFATTENPFPASPALADLIEAFKANNLDVFATSFINSTMPLVEFMLSSISSDKAFKNSY